MMFDRKLRQHAKDARKGKLGPAHHAAVVKDIAGVIRLAFQAGSIGSLWGLEGPLRAGLRADLCRSGWGWTAADLLTRDLLDDALAMAGARVRPTWNEGQSEWTVEAGTIIERLHCARAGCHKPLPDGARRFCSFLCKCAHHNQVALMKSAGEDRAVQLAVMRI
ncbi:hypothetical protein FHD67_00725 [Paracoccus haeundaensis]|uniref:Uncharacterized protein n=1 Tax=Paracoccus haeundaensis TaxID=225362 RepID=A0A5C4RC49_9RHOB|nr:hypothetical protein FHD67_00725 [Paracoccus haeundaensis]